MSCTVDVAQPPESEPNFSKAFHSARNDVAVPSRSAASKLLRGFAWCAGILASAYCILPLLLATAIAANLLVYAFWALQLVVELGRLAAQSLIHRWRGLSMEMSDTFASAYRAAILAGEAPAPEAPGIVMMRAQTRQALGNA